MATVRNPFDEDDDVSITMLDPDEEPSPESDDNGNADRKARSNDKADRAINPFTAVDEDEDNENDDEDIPIIIPESGDEKGSDTDNDSSDENPPVDNEVIDSDGDDEVTIVMPDEDEDGSVSVNEESESSSPANNDNHSSIKVTSKFNKRQSAVNDNDSSVGKNESDKNRHDDRTDSHHRYNSVDNHDDSVSSDSQQRPSFNPFVDADDNEDDNVEIDLPDDDGESSNDSVKDETAANAEGSSGLDHNDDVKNSGDESTDSVVSSGSDDHGVAVGSSDEDVVDGPSAGESSSKNGASDGDSSDGNGANDEGSFIEGKDGDEESSDDSDDVDVVMLEPEPLVEDSDDSESDGGNGSESEDDSISDEETKGIDEAGDNEADDDKSHEKLIEEASHDDHVEDDDDEDGSVDEDHSAVSEEPVASASDDESESDVDDSDESNDGHDNGDESSAGKPVVSSEDVPDSNVADVEESVDTGTGSQSAGNDDDGIDSDGVEKPSGDHDSEANTTDEDNGSVADNDGNGETVGSVGNTEDVNHDDEDKSSLSESDDGEGSDSPVDDTVAGDGDSSSDDGEDLIQSWDDEDAGSDDVGHHDEAPEDSTVDDGEDEESDNHVDGSPEENEDDSGSEDGPGGDDDHEVSSSSSSSQVPDGAPEDDEDDTDADSDEDDWDSGLDDGSGDEDDGVVFPIGDEGDWTDEEPDEYDDDASDTEEDSEEDDDDTVAEDDDGSDSEDEDDDDTADEDDGGSDSEDEDGAPGEDDDLVGLFHEPNDFSGDEDADDDEEPVDSDLEALFADKDSVAMLKGGHHRKNGRTKSKGRTSDSSRRPKTGDRNKNRGHHDSPDDGKNSSDDVDHHRRSGGTRTSPVGRNGHLHDQERSPGRIDLAEVAGDGDEVADEATRRFDEASAAGRWGSHGLATGTAIGGAVHSLGSFGRIHNHKAIEDPEKARALTVREWRMGHGVRFTARDVAALDYLTRWSYATTAQVARAGGWRDRKESRLMRRFETWEDMGWAHADREFAGPVLWTPTNAGSSFGPHAWLGGVNYHRVNPVSQSHSLGLSSLASWLLSGWGDDVLHLGDDWPVLKAELADGRAYLVSEREVRSGYTKIRSLVRGLVPIRYRCAMLGGADPMGGEPQSSRFKAFSKDYASGKAGLEDSPEFLACDPEELGREQWLWVVWGDWVWNRDPATREQSYVPVEDRYDVNTNRPLMRKSMGDVFTLLDHVPDMVIARLRNEDGSSRSLAIELELKDKGVFAYERTLASYGSRLGRLLYDRVLWVVPNSTVALSLYRAANNVGMVRGEDYEIIPFYTVERRNSYWTGADIVPAVWGRNNRVIPTIDPNSFLLS